jgi:phosphocarrier protein FPr
MNIFDFFSRDISAKIKLNAPLGVHLRPSAMIASIAKSHLSKTFIVLDKLKIDAKDMNKILALGLKDGDEIVVISKGKDAKDVVDKMVNFLSTLSDEKIDAVTEHKSSIFEFEGEHIQGTTICGSLGLGKPYFLQADKSQTKAQCQTFDNAYKQTMSQLESMGDNDIFAAQKALLETLPNSSYEDFQKALYYVIKELEGSEHEAKIADYKDLLNNVRSKMGDNKEIKFPDDDFILFADELLPSDVMKLSTTNVKGAVVKNMPQRSHAALLLRSHKIPAIVINKDTGSLADAVILDGDSGHLIIQPTKEDIELANKKINEDQNIASFEHERRFDKARTKGGRAIKVMANITDLDSAKEALMSGCEGIGLFRSEFLFQENKPTVDEQRLAYSEIFNMFDEVTIRTLDIGGDKSLPYVSLETEQNPFLGVRGIRLFKTHRELMSEQLLSILSADRKKELRIMFPMVSVPEEFIEAKEIALQIAKENNLSLENVSFGIMVEVPSVLFLMEEFNKVVDFYSIGTNDLSQYLFAIDRSHKSLTIDPDSNALYDAIALIVAKSSKPVSICGELASDEKAVKRLLKIGVESLSVTPKMVPSIKSRIRDV